jgi:hypothetical protein
LMFSARESESECISRLLGRLGCGLSNSLSKDD